MTRFNLDSLVRSNVKQLQPYSSARDEFKSLGSDMVFLDANENPYESGVNRYPDPVQSRLKQELAKIKKVETRKLLLGNGSDEVLDLIFRVFCDPQTDNIITLPPTYGMYKVLAQTNAILNQEIALTSDFQPDVAKILSGVNANTKIIFLCSPNNPTANSMDAEKVAHILNNFKGIVVIDEAYIDYSPNDSWLTRLDEFKNLVVIQTLSKAYGMAGIRLGMCFASEPIIELLNKIKPPYNVNELTQTRALERLTKMSQVKKEITLTLTEKKRLIKELKEIKFISHVFDSDANFLLVRVDNATYRYQELLSRGIVVRNRSKQLHCENCLRFTVGTSRENDKLINVLNTLS